jgi:hypothetical protein
LQIRAETSSRTFPCRQAAVRRSRANQDAGADGVILLANSRGSYLGADGQDELWQTLNDRHAVAFIHPTELPGPSVDGIPPFAADFLLLRHALSSSPASLPTLLAFAEPHRILFGSGFPFAPSQTGKYFADNLDAVEMERLEPVRLQDINRNNAEALFPRLASLSA